MNEQKHFEQGKASESAGSKEAFVAGEGAVERERVATEKFYRGYRIYYNARRTGSNELWDKGHKLIKEAEATFKELGLSLKGIHEKMLKDFEDEGMDISNPPGKNIDLY